MKLIEEAVDTVGCAQGKTHQRRPAQQLRIPPRRLQHLYAEGRPSRADGQEDRLYAGSRLFG